ncbi:MAG TPA: flagellar hook-basal body complex protein FliE [Ideonella sp.]|jgi:flagellar hook-basal body complex protein FliE|nr:flagellar hook-basal body complex protein FliE [Ideonella sp.]
MSFPDFLPPVAALPAIDPVAAAMPSVAQTAATNATPGAGFGQLVTQGLEQVNNSLLDSQVDMQRLAAGEVGNLHQVMLRMEQSRLSFQLMLQVRNRLLESYQDVMRMQV